MKLSKQQLQKNIWEYKKRVKVYKTKGWKYGNLNTKIRILKKRLKKIEKEDEILDFLRNKILEFSNVDVKNYTKIQGKTNLFANIFCKFALERGICSSKIAKYINSSRCLPLIARKSLIKNIETNLDNKITYFRFKQTLL